MRGFHFLLHSVTSDVAFEARGQTIEELFKNCARATFSVMADLKKVNPKIKTTFELGAKTAEELLFEFLNELIFLKDRDGMLFSKFTVKIERGKLSASAWGEKIDPKRHNLGVDVKAVTKHDFTLIKEKNQYRATIVLDI